MKQQIKNIAFLMLMMICFTSSHEEVCISVIKCISAPVALQKNIDNAGPANADSDLLIMPINPFIKM